MSSEAQATRPPGVEPKIGARLFGKVIRTGCGQNSPTALVKARDGSEHWILREGREVGSGVTLEYTRGEGSNYWRPR